MNMQTPDDAFSYIAPIGYSNSSECGYCRRAGRSQSKQRRFSYYASGRSLSSAFYQKLVDRCWRRSGLLLYRPNQKGACCPHYTLRLDSEAFKPKSDQRAAVNRFNRYILGGEYLKEAARRHPRSKEEARRRDTVFDLAERIHEAEKSVVKTPPQPAHELAVTLESDNYTEEKYAVFENYQRIVHQEPPSKITRTGFKRFLCDSSLRRETLESSDGKTRQLGSFHHCYRLDGKLVAIGVLDLLPHCVSAVYFLYHESIHRFSPGKLGAMREIALALEGGYRWWYSGYYIHSCPKMRYKIDYSPQYVLDPETLAWDYLDKEALAIFDRQSYVSLSHERKKKGDMAITGGLEDAEMGEENPETESKDSGDIQPLLKSNMPGILSLKDLHSVDIDHIALRASKNSAIYLTKDTVIWDTQSIDDFGSEKGRIAELVAALGPDLLDDICLDFSN